MIVEEDDDGTVRGRLKLLSGVFRKSLLSSKDIICKIRRSQLADACGKSHEMALNFE